MIYKLFHLSALHKYTLYKENKNHCDVTFIVTYVYVITYLIF